MTVVYIHYTYSSVHLPSVTAENSPEDQFNQSAIERDDTFEPFLNNETEYARVERIDEDQIDSKPPDLKSEPVAVTQEFVFAEALSQNSGISNGYVFDLCKLKFLISFVFNVHVSIVFKSHDLCITTFGLFIYRRCKLGKFYQKNRPQTTICTSNCVFSRYDIMNQNYFI